MSASGSSPLLARSSLRKGFCCSVYTCLRAQCGAAVYGALTKESTLPAKDNHECHPSDMQGPLRPLGNRRLQF